MSRSLHAVRLGVDVADLRVRPVVLRVLHDVQRHCQREDEDRQGRGEETVQVLPDGGEPRSLLCSRRGCSPTNCRSEEHTSELQSLMRISYAVFCLKKKKNKETVHVDLH